jgi:hypothetical protein
MLPPIVEFRTIAETVVVAPLTTVVTVSRPSVPEAVRAVGLA